jgi:small subunit ribosomal protein S8
MAITDPIANFLTVVRNASQAKHEYVTAPASKVTQKIARILKEEQFIRDFRVMEEEGKSSLRLSLRYLRSGKPAIRSLVRISKPGLRCYVDADSIPRVLRGLGVAIVSTSQGIMTDKMARKSRLGGEVLCKVY